MGTTTAKGGDTTFADSTSFLQLSQHPVIQSVQSFFCSVDLIELYKIKKKPAQIGSLDAEIIAKN